jgi:hypothetical protein
VTIYLNGIRIKYVFIYRYYMDTPPYVSKWSREEARGIMISLNPPLFEELAITASQIRLCAVLNSDRDVLIVFLTFGVKAFI